MKAKKTIAGICALAMLGTCGMTAFAEEVTTTTTETPAETTVTTAESTEMSAAMTEGTTTEESATTGVTTETTTVETTETAVTNGDEIIKENTNSVSEELIEVYNNFILNGDFSVNVTFSPPEYMDVYGEMCPCFIAYEESSDGFTYATTYLLTLGGAIQLGTEKQQSNYEKEHESMLNFFELTIGEKPDKYEFGLDENGNVIAYMYLDGKEYYVTKDSIEEVAPFEPKFNTDEEKNLYDMFVEETGYKPSYYTFETAEDGSLIGHMYYYFDENGISYEIEGIVTPNGVEYLDTHKTESGLMSELYNIMDKYYSNELYDENSSLDWEDNYVMSSDGELQGYLHYYFVADDDNIYHSVYLATLDGNVSKLYTVLYESVKPQIETKPMYDDLYNAFLENCVDENTTKYEIIRAYEDIIEVDGEEVTVETLIAQVWKGSEVLTYSITTRDGVKLIKSEPIPDPKPNPDNDVTSKKNPAGTGNSPKTGENTVLTVALALTFVAGTAVVASVKRFKK